MEITIQNAQPSGKNLLVGGKVVGWVSQNPQDPAVVDPGKWNVSICTADQGLWSLGLFDTEAQAVEAGKDGLKKNWTFTQWHNEANNNFISSVVNHIKNLIGGC